MPELTPRGLRSYDRGRIAPLTTLQSPYTWFGRCRTISTNIWHPQTRYPVRISLTTSGNKV